ncbi:MAG: ABC transporter permease [Bryobacterales bacterium]|nr:ABC transporter permease [Bryobacterales bacterium]
MGRNLGFSAAVISTMAVGLGSVTAMFSIVNGVLLKPLDYRQPDQLYLARILSHALSRTAKTFPVNPRFGYEWRLHCHSCESVALLRGDEFTVTGAGDPKRIPGLVVSYNFFKTLGVQPSLGRDFSPEEELPGDSHVVILADSIWRSRFKNDPNVIGRTIFIEGEPNRIVGVMPATLRLPKGEQWGPLFAHTFPPVIFRPLGIDISTQRGVNNLSFSSLVRLKSGTRPEQAASEMNAEIADFARQFTIDIKTTLVPLRDQMTEGARFGLLLLLATVAILFLIVCVNVGTLILVRTTGRYREATLRVALGASRGDLFALVMEETLVFTVVGALVGLLLAFVGLKLFVAAAPIDLPRINNVQMDWRVLTVAAAAVLVSVVISGLIPAWRIARLQPQEVLKSGAANLTESGRRLLTRELMVVFEITLSTVLLMIGAVLVLSFIRLMRVDPGFHTEHIVIQNVSLDSKKYQTPGARTRFIDEALRGLGEIAAIESASVSNEIPLRGESMLAPLSDPNQGAISDKTPTANFRFVDSNYFRTLGISLKEGRFYGEADRNHQVIILSTQAARSLWPNENPIGQHLRSVVGSCFNCPPAQVIGVVADSSEELGKQPPLMAYEPYWAADLGEMSFLVRTETSPAGVISAIREVLRSVDPEVPIGQTQTMEQIVEQSMALRRFQVYLAVAFAAAALLLVSFGVYGVISFVIAQRTPEIGIRLALGARQHQLIVMVMGRGLLPVLGGLLGGVLCGIFICRLFVSQLYGVTSHDSTAIMTVIIVMIVVSSVACWAPAQRAARIDPSRALRW